LLFVSHTRAMIGKSGIGIIPVIWTFVVPSPASGVIPASAGRSIVKLNVSVVLWETNAGPS
jgi:hypothetical protein